MTTNEQQVELSRQMDLAFIAGRFDDFMEGWLDAELEETDRKVRTLADLFQVLHLRRGRDRLHSAAAKMQGIDDMGDTSVHFGDVLNPAKPRRIWPAVAAAVLGGAIGAGGLWAMLGDKGEPPAGDANTLYDLGFVD